MEPSILLVEDDEAHAELMSRAFGSSGHTWTMSIATTLASARSLLAERDFDLVIADYRLPDGDGLDLIATADAPFIMLSSQGSESIAAESIKRGALDYFVKSPESFESMPEHAVRVLRAWGLIVEKREVEQSLRDSLAEKEVLLKEVNHRVKNNFQIVSSLLALQADSAQEPAARAALRQSENRIRSLALVHEQLYVADDLARVDFGDCVSAIASSLGMALRGFERAITIDVETEPIRLSLDEAIPLGLILNELVTNAYTHAFPAGRPGSIRISLAATARGTSMTVADDGVGLPRGIDPALSRSVGFELVRMLAAQADGLIESYCGSGLRVSVIIPAGEAVRSRESP